MNRSLHRQSREHYTSLKYFIGSKKCPELLNAYKLRSDIAVLKVNLVGRKCMTLR